MKILDRTSDTPFKVGFDYWNVLSHYPDEFGALAQGLCIAFSEGSSIKLYVLSAIGKGRSGTIEDELFKRWLDRGLESDEIFNGGVHEVIFKHPKESPQLKLKKCKELGIEMFFDDRQDVCDLLNENGILALKVPRKDRKPLPRLDNYIQLGDKPSGDLESERD